MAQRQVHLQYQHQPQQYHHQDMEVDRSFEPRHHGSRAAADSTLQNHTLVDSDTDEDEDEDEGPMMAGGRPGVSGHAMLGGHNMDLDGGDGELDGIDGEIVEDDAASDSSFSDSLSSSPSVPSSDDIDFSLVYALHTFLATVDGQASVVKGDHLTLLDDENSYWWLIRVLKTQAVGYIPAENIETPFERLARMNKHRNIDLSSATSHDHISGPTSSLAKTRFSKRLVGAHRVRSPLVGGESTQRRGPPPPAQPGPGHFGPPSTAQNPGLGKGKNVAFAAPTYFENSGNEWSDDDDEEEGSFEDGEEQEIGEGEEMEEGETESEEEWEGEEDPTAREAELEEEAEEPAVAHPEPTAVAPAAQAPPRSVSAPQPSTQPLNPTQALQAARLANKASSDSLSAKDEARSQLGRGPSPIQRAQLGGQQAQQAGRATSTSPSPGNQSPVDARAASPFSNRSASLSPNLDQALSDPGSQMRASPSTPHAPLNVQVQPKKQLRPFDELVEVGASGPGAGTRKLTLTPSIASDQAYCSDDRHRLSSSAGSIDSRRFAGDKRARDDPADSLDGHRSAGSVDSHTGSDDMHGSKGGKEASKKPKKERDDAADGGKKRKGGGLLSNLFGRKKKAGKKGAEGDEDSGRGSVDSREDATSPTPGDAPGRTSPRLQSGTHSGDHRRHSKTDMFSTDAALRQQQIEAQEVLYRQFGIQQRQPGDQANQLALPKQQPQTSSHNSPQSNLLSPSLTASSSSPGVAHRNVRPGSLIGSPSIPGFEAPELKVLRVFAGDLIASESTFKTVLLGETTTTADLIKQAMQRFHLPSEPGDQKDYYLTVKDAIGDESTLRLDQKPLLVFESMNDDLGRDAIPPSVKRSSVGSVSSISSNLSLHPAVSRLGNGDFSDDTAVKLYINRYPAKAIPDRMLSTIQEDNQLDESDSATIMSPSPRDSQLSGITGPSDVHSAAAHPGRFAARVQIHPADLPDNLVFDPNSNAIIPRQVLHERGLQSPTMSDTFREKVIFFPRNVNVFETIEHALDAFGISDGVVDGGDDVEDKLSKRRSISRVRYTLSIKRQGKEHVIPPNSKLVDVYTVPPMFRNVDRSSKEAKRRSLDAAFALGSSADLQASDPVFVLRKAHLRASLRHSGLAAAVADELAMHHRSKRPVQDRAQSAGSARSNYMTPSEEPASASVHPQGEEVNKSEKQTIAAQRAAFLSATRTAEQDEDDSLGKPHGAGAGPENSAITPRPGLRNIASTSQISVSSGGDDGYASAPESPVHMDVPGSSRPSHDDDGDEDAIEALRTAPLSIGNSVAGGGGHSQQRDLSGPAAEREGLAPEDVDDAEGRTHRAGWGSRIGSKQPRTPSASVDTTSTRSASLDSANATPTAAAPTKRHVPDSSQESFSSSRSSTTGSNSPTTPVTATSPTGESTYTPISSATRHGVDSRASHRQPIVYRDDFGLDVVMNIVEHTASMAIAQKKSRHPPQPSKVDYADLLGPTPSLTEAENVSDEVKGWYSDLDRTFDSLDRRLDQLLDSFMRA